MLVDFPEIDDVNAFKAKINNSCYSSFTISSKGRSLVADEFLKSGSCK